MDPSAIKARSFISTPYFDFNPIKVAVREDFATCFLFPVIYPIAVIVWISDLKCRDVVVVGNGELNDLVPEWVISVIGSWVVDRCGDVDC